MTTATKTINWLPGRTINWSTGHPCRRGGDSCYCCATWLMKSHRAVDRLYFWVAVVVAGSLCFGLGPTYKSSQRKKDELLSMPAILSRPQLVRWPPQIALFVLFPRSSCATCSRNTKLSKFALHLLLECRGFRVPPLGWQDFKWSIRCLH